MIILSFDCKHLARSRWTQKMLCNLRPSKQLLGIGSTSSATKIWNWIKIIININEFTLHNWRNCNIHRLGNTYRLIIFCIKPMHIQIWWLYVVQGWATYDCMLYKVRLYVVQG